MNKSNNFSFLHKAHSINLENAKHSMSNDITPIIIDNTNLKANEPKGYVVAALEMGYDESNIKILDIGTSGLTAKELANRNTHGLSVDKIEKMIQRYNSVGTLTLNKILDSKDINKSASISYSAVVLHAASRDKLLSFKWPIEIPSDWQVIADHMTICLGEMKDKDEIGKIVVLSVKKIGVSDKAIAIQVDGYKSKNTIPHITLAINVNTGGKPVDSNSITNWVDVQPFMIHGIIMEIKRK